MKKTFNINLAGYPFVIDDDAFNLLKDYLDTIRSAFNSTDDGAEIVNDIEARFAELLSEYDPERKRIVTLEDVSKVIARIGQPEEILEIEETEKNNMEEQEECIETEHEVKSQEETPPPYKPENKYHFNFNFNFRKRLFRDPQNALLGGVCSGIAHYFNIDPTLVRILTVLLTLLSATTIGIAYIILWIIVPEARTPMQRMEMFGEEPTMENIGKKVTENYISPEKEYEISGNYNGSSFGNFIMRFFSVIIKILILIGLAIGAIILFAFVIGLLGCIIALFVVGASILGSPEAMGNLGGSLWMDKYDVIPFYGIICGIGGIITLGIPLYLLVRMGWNNQKKNTQELSLGKRRSLLIIWIVGVVILTLSLIKIVRINEYEKLNHKIADYEIVEELNTEISAGSESDMAESNENAIDSINEQITVQQNDTIKETNLTITASDI